MFSGKAWGDRFTNENVAPVVPPYESSDIFEQNISRGILYILSVISRSFVNMFGEFPTHYCADRFDLISSAGSRLLPMLHS